MQTRIEKKILKVEFVGVDWWSRCVFQNIETKRFYKDTECEDLENFDKMILHTTSDFEGEPAYPISLEKCKIELIKEFN